jgi:ubiquinone/menaquinone biosynthesis C-methylase UbiE
VEKLDCTGPCADVVEFGCGYGTFSLSVAHAVGGRVLALDIEPEMGPPPLARHGRPA